MLHVYLTGYTPRRAEVFTGYGVIFGIVYTPPYVYTRYLYIFLYYAGIGVPNCTC